MFAPISFFYRDSVILNKVKDLANVSCKSQRGIAFSPYGHEHVSSRCSERQRLLGKLLCCYLSKSPLPLMNQA